MNYFVEEVQKNQITDPIEILNWYRNLYYTENSNTERGIMAAAINALFMKNKKELTKCEDCKYFNQKLLLVVSVNVARFGVVIRVCD